MGYLLLVQKLLVITKLLASAAVMRQISVKFTNILVSFICIFVLVQLLLR